MAQVTIYTTASCAYCVRAIRLCQQLGLSYSEHRLDRDHELRMELSSKYNWRTVPMIFVGDKFIGGYDDLQELHGEGKLLPMLEPAT